MSARWTQVAWTRAALSTCAAVLVSAASALGCGALLGLNDLKGAPDEAGAAAAVGMDAGPDGGAVDELPNPDAVGATTASNVDILLVVDDSPAMADKQKLLSAQLVSFLRNVATRTNDVHLGVITTSLGTMGGDVCANTSPQNALAHLSIRGRSGDVTGAKTAGFLSYAGGTPEVLDAFVRDAGDLVLGVGEAGCGLEAQLESTYRFLVQPDPWASISVTNNQASYVGLDKVLLAQRKAFLRPGSLLFILMISDEDDSSVDPRSVGGLGWAYANNTFPGSPVTRPDGKTTTAPRGTSACAINPASPDCTSCAFAATCDPSTPACVKIKTDPECGKNNGYYGASEEFLNVRFQNMKLRFGVDPQFPLSRYINAFRKQRVPNRDGEHRVTPNASGGSTVSDYLGRPTCTNPLFAAALPDPDGDLCNLPFGNRGRELVFFSVLGGLPKNLGYSSGADITKLVGRNPDVFDEFGKDAHMIQSTEPRTGLPPPSATRGDNGPDPIHGREWMTNGRDLQYACTFSLDVPRTCTLQEPSCDCAGTNNPPLCGSTLGEQVLAKAYPSIRQLRVVKGAGFYESICDATRYGRLMGTLSQIAETHLQKKL